MRMRASVRELWVRALRSGKYKQGRGLLTTTEVTPEGIKELDCCLGVLTKEAIAAGVDVGPVLWGGGQVSYGGATGTLPEAVVAWAGITWANNPYNPTTLNYIPGTREKGEHLLAFVNDRPNSSFEGIADLIENDLDREHDAVG